MAYRKSHETFVSEVQERGGGSYEVISRYDGNINPITLKHLTCENVYQTTPQAFLSGRRCPACRGTKQKTTETFKAQVFELVGTEYEVLGEYVNAYTKIKMRHCDCGFEYEIKPQHFLNYVRCPDCARQRYGRRLTTESFKSRVESLFGDEYVVLGEYRHSRKPILMKHRVCQTEFQVHPYGFIHGKHCPICTRCTKAGKTTEMFFEEVRVLGQGEYKLLSEYKHHNEKVTIRHLECGNNYQVSPKSFIAGNRCPKCRHLSKFKTQDHLIRDLEKRTKGEFTLVPGGFEGYAMPAQLQHQACQETFIATPQHFLKYPNCPKCGPIHHASKRTHYYQQKFEARLKERSGGAIKLKGDYRNSQTAVLLYHEVCQQSFYAVPTQFLARGARCPHC